MTPPISPLVTTAILPKPRDFGVGGPMGKTGLAWSIFEFARNPYYILIVIYIFAPYFAGAVMSADILASGELDGLSPEAARQAANAGGQAAIASVTKTAGMIAAFSAPFLGAALDRGGRRKPILAIFLSLIALMSFGLWWAIPGEEGLPTGVVMGMLVVAYVCYTYSEVTHNAMLTVAGEPRALPMISGLGLGFGNLAGTFIFLALVLLFALPGTMQWPMAEPAFGLDLSRFEHQRLAGPICAVWLIVFSIPFFLNGKDGGTKGASWPKAFKSGAAGVFQTLKEAAKYRQVMKFLIARMFYADAMAAYLALGAVYVSLFLGWGFLEMTAYAIYASAWAFLGGIFGGWLDSRLGEKRALISEIVVLLIMLVFHLSITRDSLFFGLIENYKVWDGVIFQTLSDIVYFASVSVLAVAATASISSSRTLLVRLAPEGRSGEFFGLYAIAGTVTVWLGPLMVEVFTKIFTSQRIGMASIAILFVIGLVILIFVKADKLENA